MKTTLKENYRVIVEPHYSLYLRGEEREDDARSTCESIVDEIKRHVDDIQSVDIIFDESEICEFCQTEWEVYDQDFPEDDIIKGLPACCRKAQDEFRTKEAIENVS